jgi:thiopeptide-type bacteriocin biosynthesis protein
VLRTPLVPFDDVRRWTGDLAVSAALDAEASDEILEDALVADRTRLRAGIAERLENAVVRDAIHIASPDLEAALRYWRTDPDSDRGRRVERSLVRYLSRMATRSTPFGLFAGNSVGVIADDTHIETAPAAEYTRFTRLDTGYLAGLIETLAKDATLLEGLCFRPNTTLALSNGRWRYVEWRPDPVVIEARGFWDRTHHLVAIDDSKYVRAILDHASASNGATIRALAELIVGETIPFDAALGFVDRLIENQVLVPELPLYVTGHDQLTSIEAAVREAGGVAAADRLREASQLLAAIDADGLGVPSGRYDTLVQTLEAFPAKIDRGHLLHVDLSKPAPNARIGSAITREVVAGAELLRRIGRFGEQSLAQFRDAFTARYEARRVPLLEALDDELGVGFPVRGASSPDAEPLLAGLEFPPRGDPSTAWGGREATLLRLLADALSSGREEIALTPRDIEALAVKEPPPLPDTFTAMVTVAAHSNEAIRRGDFRVFVASVVGSSGAQLLGRFCHANATLAEHVRTHLRAEEALDSEAVFAEVVHLAHPRAGNLIARPVLREYEITYMGRSGAPIDRQIPASDLLVSVEGDTIVLHSMRLGRRVVARNTNAHLYSRKSVNVYHFLGALQNQGAVAGAWSWGPLADAPFLPRVSAGRLVLSLARWLVQKEELEGLGRESGVALMRAVRKWRVKRQMPRYVNVADSDNTLFVDFDNVLSVESFAQLVRKRPLAILEEVFLGADELLAHGPEGRFAHELIVPFVRSAAAPGRATTSAPIQKTQIARRNPPGSEWLYAKIYSGATAADRVLASVVAPVVRNAHEQGWIDNWFFIRYADPEPHLRVRLHGDPAVLHSHVLPALNAALAVALASHAWRAQLDTYEREIERYGGDEGMLLSERIFHVDSDCAIRLADAAVRGRLGAADRWRVALVSVELLLRDLGLDEAERRDLVATMRDRYRDEHGLTPPFARPISERFRTERPRLVTMLEAAVGIESEKSAQLSRGIREVLELLHQRSAGLAPLGAELRALSLRGVLGVSLSQLVASHAHMSVVRQLRSGVRAQETVIYDFLSRLHAIPGLAGRRP